MEIMIGNTKVIINDMYCRAQTAEQRAQVLQRASNIVYKAIVGQMMRKGSKDEAV